MLKRVLVLLPPLIITLSMTACAAAPIDETGGTTPPLVQDEGLATVTAPAEGGGQPQGGSPEAIGPSNTLPTPGASSQPPLMSVWPLEADLYYLNNAGQVWKQPLLGDESAAAAVTPLD